MKRYALGTVLVLLALAGCENAPEPMSPEEPLQSRVSDQVAPDRYVVVFRPGVQDVRGVANGLAAAHGGALGFVYEHALRGFSVELPAAAAAALARNPMVAYVEPDRVRTISAQQVPTGIQRIFAEGNAVIDIDGSDDYRVDADVAIIDTGIDLQHPELNVAGGVNCTTKVFNAVCIDGGDDDHYHGTHVAGTVGALDNGDGVVGVAPGVRLWAVKVLNKRGSGYTSWIVAGIDWVTANAATIEVANMSLGGAGFSQAEYDAIQGAVNAGVAFAVAAGNEDDDANNYSPGGFDNVLSVSALADFNGLPGGGAAATCRSDIDDTLADFSNWGPEVDVAAPGVCILSTYPLEKGSYGTISGTSMASPHAAGALALLASANNPANATDVNSLYNQVKSNGNYNWTDDSGDGIKEPLLDVSDVTLFAPILVPGTGGGGTTNSPPLVSITAPQHNSSFASGTLITFSATASDAEDGNLSASITWTSAPDGSIGTGATFNTSELSVGTHTISASVTDSGKLTATDEITVTVTAPTDIVLTATGSKVKGIRYVDLVWSGAETNVDIFRNGVGIWTGSSDGSFTDNLGRLSGTFAYRVCETGTDICSNTATVIF